jgi:hypothetical protein
LKILGAIAFFGVVSISQATTLTYTCSPAPVTYSGQTGGGSISCTSAGLPGGATINSVTLDSVIDTVYDGFDPGLATVSATYSFSGPGALATSGSVNPTVKGESKSATVACPAQACIDALGGIVNLTTAYTGTNSALTAATFNARIIVDYTEAPPAQAPEPSSFIMLGSALTGLGIFARRRKA